MPIDFLGQLPIHPPIQGGNSPQTRCMYMQIDPPSHTGRKQSHLPDLISQTRSTLPYREDTNSISAFLCRNPIHPPIQGGNLPLIPRNVLSFDPPSHTGRKHSVFMRVSAPPNTSLCNLHKSFCTLLICHILLVPVDSYRKTFRADFNSRTHVGRDIIEKERSALFLCFFLSFLFSLCVPFLT